jgi:glycosyltransferase involved in cell wall biosynthesis
MSSPATSNPPPATTTPLVSVVIPAYGRVEPLKYTLRSAAASIAKSGYCGEIIVVDDGSEPSIEEQLAGYDAGFPVRFVRQANQGSIIARLTGFREAKGRYIQFLDSDDLIHPDKLREQARVMEESGADVSYCDAAEAELGPDYGATFGKAATNLPVTDNTATLLLEIQPSPYSPLFRRSFLAKALDQPKLPIHRIFDPSGDIWLYRAAAMVPGKAVKVSAPLAATGPHEENRFSQCWEKLGVGSLGIDEAFLAVTSDAASAAQSRKLVAERAYTSWRLLPHDVPREFDRRSARLWQSVPGAAVSRSRGLFRMVDGILGPYLSGKVYRRLRRPFYGACKTLGSKEELEELVARLPEVG